MWFRFMSSTAVLSAQMNWDEPYKHVSLVDHLAKFKQNICSLPSLMAVLFNGQYVYHCWYADGCVAVCVPLLVHRELCGGMRLCFRIMMFFIIQF